MFKRHKSEEPPKTSVLCIGIPESEQPTLRDLGHQYGWDLAFSRTCEEAVAVLRSRPCAVVLCDRDLSGTDWRTALQMLTRVAPSSCIVLISAVNDEYLWQEVVQRGGFDVIKKPFQQDHIRRCVDHAWLFWKSRSAAG